MNQKIEWTASFGAANTTRGTAETVAAALKAGRAAYGDGTVRIYDDHREVAREVAVLNYRTACHEWRSVEVPPA